MFEDVAVQTHIGSEGETLHSNIQMSLCGGLKGSDSVISSETFGQYLLTYDDFQTDPFGVLSNPNLVIRMNGSYFKWQVAAPLILSHVLFQRPLDDPARRKLMKDFMPPTSSSRGWGWWRSSRSAAEGNATASKSIKTNSENDLPVNGKTTDKSPITIEVSSVNGVERFNVHEGVNLEGTNPALVSSKSSTDIASASVKGSSSILIFFCLQTQRGILADEFYGKRNKTDSRILHLLFLRIIIFPSIFSFVIKSQFYILWRKPNKENQSHGVGKSQLFVCNVFVQSI